MLNKLNLEFTDSVEPSKLQAKVNEVAKAITQVLKGAQFRDQSEKCVTFKLAVDWDHDYIPF